jgi:hypothetical protein
MGTLPSASVPTASISSGMVATMKIWHHAASHTTANRTADITTRAFNVTELKQ